MVSFEIFVKAMPPSLSELKVLPSFCFAFKIPDDRAVTSMYVPANLEVMNPVCKGRYPCKGVGLYSHGLKSGDIIEGVEANDSFEELR